MNIDLKKLENEAIEAIEAGNRGASFSDELANIPILTEYFAELRVSRQPIAGDAFWEIATIGNSLPEFVHPLQFEKNLAKALDCLANIEEIYEKIQAQITFEIGFNSIRSNLLKNADDESVERHDQLCTNYESVLRYIDLKARFIISLSELLNYTTASILGAKLVFGYDVVTQVNRDRNPLSHIRSTLRILLLFNRKLESSSETLIFPISLKLGKDVDGEFISSGTWKDREGKRVKNLSTLRSLSFRIDLTRYPVLVDLDQVRLVDMGIGVADLDSGLISPAKSESYKSGRHPAMYGFELRDTEGGVPLDIGASPNTYEIKPLRFTDVFATRDLAVSWSGSSRIVNVDPRRRWEMTVSENSNRGVLGKSLSGITDITMFAKITHTCE